MAEVGRLLVFGKADFRMSPEVLEKRSRSRLLCADDDEIERALVGPLVSTISSPPCRAVEASLCRERKLGPMRGCRLAAVA